MKKFIRRHCTPSWWAHSNGSHNLRGPRDLIGEDMEEDEYGYTFRKTSCSSFYYYCGTSWRCLGLMFSKYHKGRRLSVLKSSFYWLRRALANEH